MSKCEECKREFDGHVFTYIIPNTYPNKLLMVCSECFIKAHENRGIDISIVSENISKYKKENDYV